MKLKRLWLSSILSSAILALVSCSKTKSKPELQYMPDMDKGPSIKAQQVSTVDPEYTSLRAPVAGTISLDYEPYPFATADTVGPAQQLFNPLPRTIAALQTGRKYYNTY